MYTRSSPFILHYPQQAAIPSCGYTDKESGDDTTNIVSDPLAGIRTTSQQRNLVNTSQFSRWIGQFCQFWTLRSSQGYFLSPIPQSDQSTGIAEPGSCYKKYTVEPHPKSLTQCRILGNFSDGIIPSVFVGSLHPNPPDQSDFPKERSTPAIPPSTGSAGQRWHHDHDPT